MNELQLVYDLAIRASDVLVCIGALAFLGLVWMDDGLQKEYKMTNEQQRKMLEAAAKACGLRHVDYSGMDYDGSGGLVLVNENGCHTRAWNPLANPADCAEMCAELNINWINHSEYVLCREAIQQINWAAANIADHDNSRLKAWMYAATMVAAKIGDLK